MINLNLEHGLFHNHIFDSAEDLEYVKFQDIGEICDELEQKDRYFELELLRYYQLNTAKPDGKTPPSQVYISLKEDVNYAGFDAICFAAYVPNCDHIYKHFFLARSNFAGSSLHLIVEKTRKEDGQIKLKGDYDISSYIFTDLYHGISIYNRKYGAKRKPINKIKRDLAKFYDWTNPKDYIHVAKGEDE
jgi:hypothetical protein